HEQRFVSMANSHLAGLALEIVAENWSGTVCVRSGIEGDVKNQGVARYRGLADLHLDPIGSQQLSDNRISLSVRTRQSRVEVSLAARTELFLDRKSTRLNSSHVKISYAVFCLKKKKYNQL